MTAPLRPPEVMRKVHVQTLRPETQDSTLCASKPSIIHTLFQIECTTKEALGKLIETTVYVSILTRRKSQRFFLRHREVKRSLKVSWNGVDLDNTALPKHLDVIFDMTLSYNQHVQNTKMNVAYPHNLLKKFVSSKSGANTSTTGSTVLAMCYLIAEYVDPVSLIFPRRHTLPKPK